MDLKDLDRDLVIRDKRISLNDKGPGLKLAKLDDLLKRYNNDQPLVITNASKSTTADAIIVQGVVAFLSVPAADLTATFKLDAKGKPMAFLRMQLIGESRLPGGWKFSTSFPNLPPFPLDPTGKLLDEMQITSAALVLATDAGTDDVSQAPLEPGLNFNARLQPSGLLALFDSLLAANSNVLLFGTILLPRPGDGATLPVPKLQYPWQMTGPVPGIQLRADLGLDVTIGKLRLHDTSLRIYCPPTSAWMKSNSSYAPATAVTGAFEIPSAGIRADASALVTRNATAVTLDAVFQGVTLAGLGKLTDLANGSDLLQQLPSELKSVSSIELRSIGIAFSGSISGSGISMVYLQVGLPSRWTVISGLFELSAPEALFLVTRPFVAAERTVGVILGGTMTIAGAEFDVSTEAPGFLTRITLLNGARLPLDQFFRTHVPGVTAPPLSIDQMELIAVPGKEYSFIARMADDPGWTLDFGRTSLTIENVEVEIAKKTTGAAQGAIAGTLAFDPSLVLDVRYAIPAAFSLRADLPAFSLSKLIGKFDQLGIAVPAGFDFNLTQTHVLINLGENSRTFQLATVVANAGLLAFTAEKEAKWGVAALLDVDSGSLSSIPGLGGLAKFEQFVGLERLIVLCSSLDTPEFAELSLFAAPALQSHELRLPKGAASKRGFSVYGQLSSSKSAGFSALSRILGVPIDATVTVAITVSVPDPTTNSRLFLTLAGRNIAGVTIDGTLGILLQSPDVGVFLSGTARTSIDGQALTFSLGASVLENGVLIAGSMQGTVRFGKVQLSNLGLIIGGDFEGIPSVGVAATIDVSDFESSVAVFFDSADPVKSLLSGSIDGASLLDVAKVLAGQNIVPIGLAQVLGSIALRGLKAFTLDGAIASALDKRDLPKIAAAFLARAGVNLPGTSDRLLLVTNTPGQVWHITDMTTMDHYHLARNGKSIDVTLQAQFYAAPKETFIGTLKFPQGFKVAAEMDFLFLREKIDVTIEPSRGIAVEVSIDPIVIVSSSFFSITGAQGTPGPLFSVATYSRTNADPRLAGPHILITGGMKLLGLISAQLFIDIDGQGLNGQLTQQVTPATRAVLTARVRSLSDMSVSGDLSIGVKKSIDLGRLGSVPIDIQLSGGLQVSLVNGRPAASVDGAFAFQGVSFSIPRFSIAYTDDLLTRIENFFPDQIKSVFLAHLTPARWVAWARNGIVAGIAGLEAGWSVVAVAGVLQSAFSLDAKGVAAALAGAGIGTAEIAEALRRKFGLTGQQLAETLKSVGAGIEDIVRELKTLDPAQLARILKDLQYTPGEIARAFKNVLGMAATSVVIALQAAGFDIVALGGVLKEVFGFAGEAAASTLNAAGVAADAIASVLKTAFGWPIEQATNYFKNVLGFGADLIAGALGVAGYPADAISSALAQAFDWVVDPLNPSNW